MIYTTHIQYYVFVIILYVISVNDVTCTYIQSNRMKSYKRISISHKKTHPQENVILFIYFCFCFVWLVKKKKMARKDAQRPILKSATSRET